MSIVYMTYRGRTPVPLPRSPLGGTFQRPSSPANASGNHNSAIRDRTTRASHSVASGSTAAREDLRKTSPLGIGEEQVMIGAKGCVWGTEGREYRYDPDSSKFEVGGTDCVGIARMTERYLLSCSRHWSLPAYYTLHYRDYLTNRLPLYPVTGISNTR